jgi:hypothetical protein
LEANFRPVAGGFYGVCRTDPKAVAFSLVSPLIGGEIVFDAAAGRGDWILCQITSKSYGDEKAITLDALTLRAARFV